MKDKKIAIYLVVTVLVFSLIIGITVYMVTGKKKIKNNGNNQTQNTTTAEPDGVSVRKVDKSFENPLYVIDLYTDGTATAKVKSDIDLWGELKTSNDEKYKKEKNDLMSVFSQNRQIDSNNKKIEQVFISNYIGDIYDNYKYGKAVIKCEGNVFYLIDLTADKKIRIAGDWTEKCKNLSDNKILNNLQSECLSELIKNENVEENKNFVGTKSDNKYKYIIVFNNKDEYSIFVHSVETDELLLYVSGKISEENTTIESGISYYKFNFTKPNGGVISGTIKQENVIITGNQNNDSIIDIKKPIYLDIQDFSTQSGENLSTDGYCELKIK